MKTLLKLLTLLVILGLGAYLFLRQQWGPYGEGGVVYIPKGYTVNQMARELTEAGILRNPWSFKLMVRWQGVGKFLQAGEYQFPPGVSTAEVVEKLRKGERLVHYLTVPEGYAFSQIAQLIADAGIAELQEVNAAFRDSRYLSLLDFPAISLEGYLYPDTYQYDRGTSLEELLKNMLQNFNKNVDPELRDRARQAGWSIPQWVTLASIIEKETGKAEERSRISSVFHNRLQIGMALQSDPTVIYGLTEYDGNIRRRDLKNPHPFNTYVHGGLPPGPIASPGKDSLRAVLYPESSDYFFFVSRGDGSHHFSKNLAEHNAAVRRYQLGGDRRTPPLPP